jgi:hypothetical protein
VACVLSSCDSQFLDRDFAAFVALLHNQHKLYAALDQPPPALTVEQLEPALAAYVVCSAGMTTLEALGACGVPGDPLAACGVCALRPTHGWAMLCPCDLAILHKLCYLSLCQYFMCSSLIGLVAYSPIPTAPRSLLWPRPHFWQSHH